MKFLFGKIVNCVPPPAGRSYCKQLSLLQGKSERKLSIHSKVPYVAGESQFFLFSFTVCLKSNQITEIGVLLW